MSDVHFRRLRRSLAATAAAMALLTGWVALQATSSTEAVRLRNALLIETPKVSVGQWAPEDSPLGYLYEGRNVPESLARAAQQAVAAVGPGELVRSRALVAHLLRDVRDSGGIHAVSIETTYRAIVDEGRGYCSDYIDVFVALAHAAKIPVRSWAFSFDGFGGYGHIVAEIYDHGLGQWVMLDVFNNVQPVSRIGGQLLSVHEFRTRYSADVGSVDFVRIGPGRVAYANGEKLRDYYLRGLDQWYLWNGNNVVTLGEAQSYRLLSGVPAAAQLLAIALGDYPRIIPVSTATNQQDIDRMRTLGARLQAVFALIVVLGLALLVQVLLFVRARLHARRSAALNANELGPAALGREDRHA